MLKSLLLASAVVAGSSVAFAGDVATGAAPTVIVIKNMEFSLPMVTVEPGTTVTWVNEDETPHTVTDKGGELASPGLDTGDRYEHTFRSEGDYPYYCAVHPFMTGIVHVRRP